MDNTGILVILALLVLVAVGFALFSRRRRTESLRNRFGPEYDHAVQNVGDRAKAEAELAARQQRVAKLDIRQLPEPERQRFAEAWRDVQARFVDSPGEAVTAADRLVKELMQAKGYPMGDFEQRAADISVDHPHVVNNYRAARTVAHANERGEATTDHLRGAMVHYRSLFEDLLGTQAVPAAPAATAAAAAATQPGVATTPPPTAAPRPAAANQPMPAAQPAVQPDLEPVGAGRPVAQQGTRPAAPPPRPRR